MTFGSFYYIFYFNYSLYMQRTITSSLSHHDSCTVVLPHIIYIYYEEHDAHRAKPLYIYYTYIYIHIYIHEIL